MKNNKFVALLLAALMLFSLCACGSGATMTSVHPNIAQSGTDARAELSLPESISIESAGETATVYELKMDAATSISQIERCLGIKLPESEKKAYERGALYTIGDYYIDIDSERGFWSYTMLNPPRTSSALSMSDEEAIEIAKSFVEENELWPGGVDNIRVTDQTGLLDDGTDGISRKNVYFYPQVDGKNVLGVYRISFDISLDGQIVSVFYLVNPVGESTTVDIKSRSELSSDLKSESYSASFSGDLTDAKITDCKLGYYADGVSHDGKTYLFPVYIMTGEGTNAAGEKETFDIIIDAQK